MVRRMVLPVFFGRSVACIARPPGPRIGFVAILCTLLLVEVAAALRLALIDLLIDAVRGKQLLSVPKPLTRPSSRTRMRSASCTLEMRWAMMIFVVFGISSRRALRMRASVAVSTALVESSRIRIFGFFSRARAMHRRCFLPAGDIRAALLDVGLIALRHGLE